MELEGTSTISHVYTLPEYRRKGNVMHIGRAVCSGILCQRKLD